MKKQVKFVDGENAYRFMFSDGEGDVFEIEKSTLTFHAGKFYECFFKGLHEKPDYSMIPPEGEIKGQAKHVYDTVEAIISSACKSIDNSWFSKSDEGNSDAAFENLSECTF